MDKRIVLALAAFAVVSACGGPEEISDIEDPLPNIATMQQQPKQDIVELDDEQLVAETQASLSIPKSVCVGAVALGANLGCATARNACLGTTAITIGGTAFPCLIVLAVARAAVPATAAV